MSGHLSLLSLFAAIYVVTAQTGVCYNSISVQQSLTTYARQGFGNDYNCGWWRRCRRTLYRSVPRTSYTTGYTSQFGCCAGYSQSDSTCQPVCNGGCHNGGVCTAPNRCRCTAGWTGANCNTDINECASSSTNNCEQVCVNNRGSYTCSCNTGYRLNPDGRTCADIHECNEMTHRCQHNCMNNAGSYTCSCMTGYTLSSDTYSCIDNNECQLGTDCCGQVCHNNAGSYTCSCRSGYSRDANGCTCSDINECSAGTDSCDQDCHNTVGSYTCSCNTGYTLNANGRTCDDINECATPNHGCEHRCVNTRGSYRCECNIGYRLDADGRACNDINECTLGTDNCEQVCHNTVGSFFCTCRPGSTLDSNGYTCNDINECANPDLNNCRQVCVNTDGSYNCACDPGYALNTDLISCSDVDECEMGTDLCSQNCHNTIGSYTCSCRNGYTLNANGLTCDDIDECTVRIHQCSELCINIPGGYNCSCRTGYGLNSDGFSCSDIDECAVGTALCDQDCTNTLGSYTCSCRTGFIIDADGYTCDDFDECGGDHMCEVACNNTAGSFHCACRTGYVLNSDERTCRDLDECAAGVDMCDQNCFNTIGSYTCSCNSGYTLNYDGFRCDDINECAAGSVGNTTCLEVCVNTPGSWECGCFPGYTLLPDRVSCRDENECTEGENQCNQTCHNTIGSYTCSCNSSTTLNTDGYNCDDIDECAMDLDNCAEVCVNTYGGFNCSCNPGYTINTDGRTCRDANECLTGQHQCEQLCINTVGSYNCSCNPGYALTSNGRSCLGPPQDLSFSMVESTSMTLSWGLPQNDSSDGAILNYVVDCSSEFDRNFALDVMVPSSGERRALLEGLLPYTNYNCCVLVETDMGMSPFGCRRGLTVEEEPSNPPNNIMIHNGASDRLTFTMEPPIRPNGIITAYNFYITFDNGTTVVIPDYDATGTFVLEGLLPYQLVTVEVSANTSVGEGPKSDVDEIRTAQAAPSVPTGVMVRVTSNASMTVSWNPPEMANGVLQNYTVMIYNELSDYTREFEIQPSDRRWVNIDDLEPFIPYTVEVRASTMAGDGEPFRMIEFTEHGVPIAPPPLTSIIRISEDTVRVFWDPLTPDEARGVLTRLEIAYQPTPADGVCSEIGDEDIQVMTMEENIDTQSEAEITGLDPTKEYCMAIQVSTSAGESGYSHTLKAHLPSDVYVQIRLKLPVECEAFIAENTALKATDVSSAIVNALLLDCNCPYSLEYVTHSRLLCGSTTHEVIYQANLLNTDAITAAELRDILQQWVNNAPTPDVAGTPLQIDSYCQVNVTMVGDTDDCLALNPTTPTTLDNSDISGTRPSHLVPAIAGGVGGGLGLIVILLILMGIILATRRRRTAGSNIKDKKADGFSPLDAEGTTQLVGQRDIGTLPRGRQNGVASHTPADYDRVEESPSIENPLFNVPEEMEELKEDLGNSFSDYSDDGNDYTDMN